MKSFAYTLAVLCSLVSIACADNAPSAEPTEVVVEEAAVEEVPAVKAADQTADAGSETPAASN